MILFYFDYILRVR